MGALRGFTECNGCEWRNHVVSGNKAVIKNYLMTHIVHCEMNIIVIIRLDQVHRACIFTNS